MPSTLNHFRLVKQPFESIYNHSARYTIKNIVKPLNLSSRRCFFYVKTVESIVRSFYTNFLHTYGASFRSVVSLHTFRRSREHSNSGHTTGVSLGKVLFTGKIHSQGSYFCKVLKPNAFFFHFFPVKGLSCKRSP